MKQLTKLGIIINLLTCSSAFATEPVDGFYFGVLGELSYSSQPLFSGAFQQFVFTQNQISMEPVGGGAGLALGYKIQNFRLEGELLYNVNSYRNLKVGACTLVSPNVEGPQGGVPCIVSEPEIYAAGLGFKGGTSDYYGMFNAYYDFQFGLPEKSLVPYLGFGLGYSLIQNQAQFETNKYSSNPYPISFKLNSSSSSPAIQGMLGLYYYMDDFATIGMDYRYLTTLTFNNNNNKNTLSSNASNTAYGIHTLNFVVNFVLGKGGSDK